jgi:predicted homoserine dehydrogenase-like protein
MIIVDTELQRLEEAGTPIRVGLVGAGYIAEAAALQIVNATPGMELVAIANRTVQKAIGIWREIGRDEIREATTLEALEEAIGAGTAVVACEHELLSRSGQIDVILELTGAVGFGAEVALAAFAGGKHVVTMNAEMDATLGPVLRHRAKAAGVIYTLTEGDQPGVQMNLYRWVRTLGLTPLVCGNIKGMIDRYRTPDTQAGFARQWGQSPNMVTSFADGTKVSMEQACVANATGMCVAKRGMGGPEHNGHIDRLVDFYDVDALREMGGVVDYALGSEPSPGVYVFATHEDGRVQDYLRYAKLGQGPLYSFYIPYHLFHLEVPISVARAAIFRDTTLAADGPMRVEVVATAKRALRAGETLDGIGGFMTYGECENAWVSEAEGLLPMGIAEGCVLVRDVPKDAALRLSDVRIPEGRLVDALRAEQAGLHPAPDGGRGTFTNAAQIVR